MRQRPHCLVFIATSADGFVAREDGRIDWLLAANRRVPLPEDCGYAASMKDIDGIVMGRASYEQVAAFDAWPFGDLPVTVMCRRGPQARPTAGRVTWCADAPAALLTRLYMQGHRRLHIDGGRLIQSFLREGLIDEMTITTLPCLLGSGRRLFGPLDSDVALFHVATRSWPFGFVQTHWRLLSQGVLS